MWNKPSWILNLESPTHPLNYSHIYSHPLTRILNTDTFIESLIHRDIAHSFIHPQFHRLTCPLIHSLPPSIFPPLSLSLSLSLFLSLSLSLVYMWQMSSVFSHESLQRNVAGHLIDENVFKTTRSFRYHWFLVSTLHANATKHGQKSILNLWIVVNRKKHRIDIIRSKEF